MTQVIHLVNNNKRGKKAFKLCLVLEGEIIHTPNAKQVFVYQNIIGSKVSRFSLILTSTKVTKFILKTVTNVMIVV
jgi:hypothetical protein